MELRQLRYFVAVAEDMHFNRAAERLHIAQPALSQQIRRLEHELKTTLFHRTTRSVELTDTGRVLLAEARRVLADVDYTLAAVRHAADGETGLLRLGFVSSAALQVLPTLVLALQERWPRLHLTLEEGTTDRQIEDIREGRIDIGVAREMAPLEGFVSQPLAKEPLVAAVPVNHRLAEQGRIRIADLAGERFVVFPRRQVSRLYDHIAALCRRAGVELEVAQEAVQFPTILGLVAAQQGVAIVPDSLRALHLPGIRYLALTDKDAYSVVSMIASEDRRQAPLVDNCFRTAAVLDFAAAFATGPDRLPLS